MSPFVYVFISLLALQLVVQFVLNHLNSQNAKSAPLSPILDGLIDQEKRASAFEYTRAKMRFAHLAQTITAVMPLFYLLFGIPGRLTDLLSIDGAIIPSHILVVTFGGISFLIDSSLAAYNRFTIEKKFGFNRASASLFLTDRIKSAILSAVIACPVVFGLLYAMRLFDAWWWIFVWTCSIFVSAAVALLHPLIIAPIFNRFTPLPDGDLRERLIELSNRLDFPFAHIFVMDGSRRSGHGNAYFTGIGAGRRIVLYDTLLSRLEPNEIEAVLAHEIGHRKLGHVRNRMVAFVFASLFMFFLMHLLRGYTPMFVAFGFAGPTDAGLLILLLFCSAPFLFFIIPIASFWSKANEFAADSFAARSINDANSLQSALVSISTESLSNPNPHPLYARFYYSHPALAERLAAIAGA